MEADRGLVIYRASRLEALLDPLLALMQAAPPRHALAAHSVIAAHPGMQKWLSREIAMRRGVRGIAANLRIELPSAWLERLAQQVLGEEAVALRSYRREVLRWRIHECLDAIDDPVLGAYLAGDSTSRAQRRFQLADRLARIYSQYLVYRPDWLRDWAAGRTGAAHSFLAPLWKMLRQQIGQPHRGEMLARLIAALAPVRSPSAQGRSPSAAEAMDGRERPAEATDSRERPWSGEEPLHVFGFAHLAPSELDVLRAVARHRLVVLYVPDPCREFWGGLRSERARLRELVLHDPESAQAQGAFLEQDHPLLASWGRMGQHFLLALDDSSARIDERHWQDQTDTPRLDSRLHRLQESIRQLKPALIEEDHYPAAARADRSLRVHACHTRLRELEVLRDALLRERAEDPQLKPSDIVVMMPNIQAYLPLLPTVFGESGRHDGPLPYHCFDVAVARSHPLFAALRQLLALPQSRITAPEVVDLLAVPAIARRFNLAPGDIDTLAGWLREGRVAWALDAAFRTRFDVPAIAEHTFAWAVDRMLAGYVLGVFDEDERRAVTLADASRVVPFEGVAGPQAALIGALDALLLELNAWCALGQEPRRASEWAKALEERLEALFLVDPTDDVAREAKAIVLRFVRAVGSEPGESGLDPLLDFSVVREVLLDRLDAVPERQRFLLGGVTFCGMVPQRSIPFKVVAVLGLNDGEYPRAGGDAGLDLMSTHRRLGDRDVRSDDRYLFLETVMSARATLHLSYIGEGVRDGQPRNPAAPLAELMAALDAAQSADAIESTGGESDAERDKRQRPWLIRHPLQPFDDRYFDARDEALFSFRKDFAAMRGEAGSAPVPFVSGAPPAHAEMTESPPIPLSEVLAYYKDPAKQLLASALNLRLDALGDDGLRDSEPLEARIEAIDQVAKKLFLAAVASADHALPDTPPDWLRLTGLLPPGRLGDAAWMQEIGKARGLVTAAGAYGLFQGGLPPKRPTTVDRRLAASDGRTQHVLHGELRRVYEKNDARWVMDLYPTKDKASELDFKQRIPFFLEWALLRLDDPAGQCRVGACLLVAGEQDDPWAERFDLWDRRFIETPAERESYLRDLERRVAGLLEFWQRSQRQPQWYFPVTSWAAATSDAEAARQKWLGGFNNRAERDYAPGYARLLAGDREFGDGDDADFKALQDNAARLYTLIDLSFPLASPE
jgi:exodeoxyribonuclease V gamma subunit